MHEVNEEGGTHVGADIIAVFRHNGSTINLGTNQCTVIGTGIKVGCEGIECDCHDQEKNLFLF